VRVDAIPECEKRAVKFHVERDMDYLKREGPMILDYYIASLRVLRLSTPVMLPTSAGVARYHDNVPLVARYPESSPFCQDITMMRVRGANAR
jgi:hypothetical protein